MPPRTRSGNIALATALRERRLTLGLSIEEAASRAGVTQKTWSRYETGASIRTDKVRGICKALGWTKLPETQEGGGDDFDEPFSGVDEDHEAWSTTLAVQFGKTCAIVFAFGSDLLIDEITEDMTELSQEPRGTHVGQLSPSMLSVELPPQFIPRYDYEFLYSLRSTVNMLRLRFARGILLAGSVIEELALYLIMQYAELLGDTYPTSFDDTDEWTEWVGSILGDLDLEYFLFNSSHAVTPEEGYHFDNWWKAQFWQQTNES